MRLNSLNAAALIIGSVAVSACDTQVNNCPIDADPSLRQSGITTELRRPYRCEYTIFAALSFVEYESMFYAPDTNFAGRTAWTDVRNMNGQQVSPFGYSTVFQRGFGCSFSPACAFTQLSFQAGTTPIDAPPPYGNKFREISYISVELPPYNSIGNATLTLNGTLGALAGVNGTSSVVAPYQGSWSADMTADTLSFQYRWYVNGALISGASSRTLSVLPYGESGTYSLTAVAELMDQTTDTVTRQIGVIMGAAWTGPTAIGAGETGTWQAIGYAARYPLSSCQWYVDGSLAESSSCTLYYAFPTPQTTPVLEIHITDARGETATGSNSVWVHTAGCYPPDCYETLRVPADSTKGQKTKRKTRD